MDNIFGKWINNTSELRNMFINAEPFSNVIIDNFFNEEFCTELLVKFPLLTDSNWYKYYNPIEHKYAMNKFDAHPIYKKLFDILQSNYLVQKISLITNIEKLENDPHLHGAGIHYHPKGGKLDMHLDYSLHPISNRERRVNLIIYLNKEWNSSWGGNIELFDNDYTKCITSIPPIFNRAVLFKTNDISYHGLPTPISCDENNGRKSIAIYYVSDTKPEIVRHKANFFPLPNQPVNDNLKNLYKIRNTRLITQADLDQYYPNWEKDGNGYW